MSWHVFGMWPSRVLCLFGKHQRSSTCSVSATEAVCLESMPACCVSAASLNAVHILALFCYGPGLAPLPDLSGFSLSLVMKGNSEPLESHNRNLVSTSSGQSGPNPSSFPMPSPVSQWEARARSHLERANQQEPHCRPCTHTAELHLHGCIWLPWCPSASVVLTNRDVVLSAYLTQSELWPPYRYVQVRTEIISDAPCALLHMN